MRLIRSRSALTLLAIVLVGLATAAPAIGILSSASKTCWRALPLIQPFALHLDLLRQSGKCHGGSFLLGDVAKLLIASLLAASLSTLLAASVAGFVLVGGILGVRAALAAVREWVRSRFGLPNFPRVLTLGTAPRLVIYQRGFSTSALYRSLRLRGPPVLLVAGS